MQIGHMRSEAEVGAAAIVALEMSRTGLEKDVETAQNALKESTDEVCIRIQGDGDLRSAYSPRLLVPGCNSQSGTVVRACKI